ncbi:MAG: hypothetical protein ACKOXJ_07655 [Alphaproteobacteria bacterium]
MQNQLPKIQFPLNENQTQSLSKEALEILETLEQIENHTAELRKRIMAEVAKNQTGNLHLNLDEL